MSNPRFRTIFMGTPDFAVPGLEALLQAPDLEIVGVFTQTDKPVGRQQKLTPPPIKEIALKNKLKIFQPEKIKNEVETISSLKPDLIIVIAYGKIIPPTILNIPKYGCLNVHASLLPKYRGAACLNAPIINGEPETGLTIMKIDAGLDTGPILRQAIIKLTGLETLEELHDILAKKSAEILVPTIHDWLAGKIILQNQDDSQASYVKMITKEDGRLNWQEPAVKIERLIRGFNPWPGTFSKIGQQTLKIISVDYEILNINQYKAGTIFLKNGRMAIQCGQNSLVILKLQLEGKKIMTAEEFLRGNKSFVGQVLE